jgi:protein-L-isoaspartate(D-aspartate) O-methyltransferase
MEAVRRVGFLPAGERQHADLDVPLAIGWGQTNSQPTTVRQMLELLDVRAGDRVLDVGAGSGWTTALLAWLTGAAGKVVGVERVPGLVAAGAANVERAGMPWASLRQATPGLFGDPAEGPYDRILVSAQARELPEDLVDQLAPGGVLVAPVNGRMLRAVRPLAGGPPDVEEHGWYRFVPLVRDQPESSAPSTDGSEPATPPPDGSGRGVEEESG